MAVKLGSTMQELIDAVNDASAAPSNMVTTDTVQTINAAKTFSKEVAFDNQIRANGSVGTAGQVLTSQGTNKAPVWKTPSSGSEPYYIELTSSTGSITQAQLDALKADSQSYIVYKGTSTEFIYRRQYYLQSSSLTPVIMTYAYIKEPYIYEIHIYNDLSYTRTYTDIEDGSKKVSYINSGNKTSHVYYPSVKAVADYVDSQISNISVGNTPKMPTIQIQGITATQYGPYGELLGNKFKVSPQKSCVIEIKVKTVFGNWQVGDILLLSYQKKNLRNSGENKYRYKLRNFVSKEIDEADVENGYAIITTTVEYFNGRNTINPFVNSHSLGSTKVNTTYVRLARNIMSDDGRRVISRDFSNKETMRVAFGGMSLTRYNDNEEMDIIIK